MFYVKFNRLFLEAYFMNKTCLFKKWKYYGSMRNLFFVFSPIILYSRLYLNYHSFEQVSDKKKKTKLKIYHLDFLWISLWIYICYCSFYLYDEKCYIS